MIKSASEIEHMRTSGRLLAEVFHMLDDFIQPGMSTLEINDQVEDFIFNELESRPASLGQYGYEFSLNSSPNQVICHGKPHAEMILGPQDIVNIDITLEKNGFISDSSKMFLMPEAPPEARQLCQVTYEAMTLGIQSVRPGSTLGDIGYAIQSHVESHGYSVVRDYCGHGIGREMHEEPQVLHYGRPGKGMKLQPGMTFTIEPMINAGSYHSRTLEDGWTVVTRDGALSAQYEHTILVTPTGYEILTLRDDESIQG